MKKPDSSYGRTNFRLADLIADPTLDTHVVAGAAGLDRPVLWAHSCEMSDPDRWLGPSELLMTMGTVVPAGGPAQREFIRRLEAAGLAGMTIGETVAPPRYTKAMLEEADERSFPVLFTGPDTPFAAIGRAIAAANAHGQTVQVLQLSRLYRATASQDRRSKRSGRGLQDVFGTAIRVVDDATGCVVIGGPAVVEHHEAARRLPLRTQRPTHVTMDASFALDAFTQVHLSQVLEVDANSILQDAEQTWRSRERSFAGWLGDRDLADTTRTIAALWGTGRHSYRVVASAADDPERVHLAVALSELPVLTLDAHDSVLSAARTSDLPALRALLEQVSTAGGVSGDHTALEDVGAAAAEAAAALQDRAPTDPSWTEFEGRRVSMLARSRREAQSLIDSVLGPLATDTPRMDGLRETLFAFLDNDLRWQETARHLGIHRQTLTYRLQQVESLTGRDVHRTKDIAELWLARASWTLFEH